MDWLDRLTEEFSGLFWLLIMFGSWVAALLKKGQGEESEVDLEEEAIELVEEAVDFDWEDVADIKPQLAQPPSPPPIPQARVSRAAVGALDFDKAASDLGTKFDVYESTVGDSKLGELKVTGPAQLGESTHWDVGTSWRQAIIIKEVLGPPRAFQELEPPGLAR